MSSGLTETVGGQKPLASHKPATYRAPQCHILLDHRFLIDLRMSLPTPITPPQTIPLLPTYPHRYGVGWPTPTPAAGPCFHDPLGRPVRLTGWSDPVLATRRVAGATQRLSDRRETPLCDRPTGLSLKVAGAPHRDTCRAYVLRPANQLR